MTTLYFTALVVTYLVNGIYFGSKLIASSSARKGRSKNTAGPSDMQTRCCS